MLVEVRNRSEVSSSYRSARVQGMFNVEAQAGAEFNLDADLPVDEEGQPVGDWKVGVVVGPSGSGKSSIGRALSDLGWVARGGHEQDWGDKPVVDAIGGTSFEEATGHLATVGLGTVPSWLRPYAVLSEGEKFRADLARVLVDRPERVIVDEFTSVVDRQIARVGAMAFVKAWRRGPGRVILLTCHRDILEWINPDWVVDTEDAFNSGVTDGSVPHTEAGPWTGGGRPKVRLQVVETGWSYWSSEFRRHHYLHAGPMPMSTAFVGFVDRGALEGGEPAWEPAVHLGMSGFYAGKRRIARACRMVVKPEWQGAGIGMRFLNTLCQRELDGAGFIGAPVPTIFHTNHPGLVAGLRRDPKWVQVSQTLHGGSSWKRIEPGREHKGLYGKDHWRGVQGFRYVGDRG